MALLLELLTLVSKVGVAITIANNGQIGHPLYKPTMGNIIAQTQMYKCTDSEYNTRDIFLNHQDEGPRKPKLTV